ncbi:hypothetical protein HKD37_14G040034 [Glycine soja]
MMAMAPKKLLSKRARKDAMGEGSSAASQERRVQLRKGEYTEFQEEVSRRQWTQLARPMAKYDPEIVMEFYANAWPTEEGVRDKRS